MNKLSHVAFIMDGNGRWAESRGLPRSAGHKEGAERVREITTACSELGVKALTLYSFSTENWRRPKSEIATLWDILKHYLAEERKTMMDNQISLRAIGQVERLPLIVRLPLKALIRETSRNTGLVLNLALSYGGRAEITETVKQIALDIKRGALNIDDISESMISHRLSTGGLPDPDLIIRTSGEFRLSNFLLWQSAYSEIHVTDVSWPEFTRDQLRTAILDFSNRTRRFGKTNQQIN